ncbi:MAG: FAD-binding oxidoreductase, partial [Steroidobacteraceae bacterium]|nr:FAD-binding oxidoreductase [Steroidobacteraceae bacterium]
MSTTIAIDAPDQALAALRAALGADAVITDVASRQFYSTDVYRSGALPLAIVRPRGTAELAAALRALTPYGLPVVPRGGGMSYTDAYLPIRSHTVMVDVLAMNRVLEVNAADGYVTVECGATWKALHDALVPQGVRTPYWGPLSGLRSTVGGALSQGSIFLGSGRYGTVAESVLGLDVVLVDGQVLRLGSHANKNGAPFFRQYGPDLLGLFLSDTGSLGIKTTATLRLIRRPTEIRCLSFAFRDAPTMFAAMAEVARAELVAELFAFDPRLQRQRLKRSSLTADVRT